MKQLVSSSPIKEVCLMGDWTISGLVHQMNSLLNFSSYHVLPGTSFTMDCSCIEEIDLAGLQLLYVWLQCVKIRGVQPGLVNIPDGIRKSIERLGSHSEILNDYQVTTNYVSPII